MLWRSSKLIGMGVRATDGAVGSISDLLFEDTAWNIRWVVADAGSWLSGRDVLLPPSALGDPTVAPDAFLVNLTRKQVEEAPGAETDAPVSRQLEADIYGHYGWAPYWYPGYAAYPGYVPPLMGPAEVPPPLSGLPGEDAATVRAERQARSSGDPHLRSVAEVTGYHIHASDGSIGHVEEFLLDDEGWAIRYIVVDTRNWWPGKKVLVPPHWCQDVNWGERELRVDLTRAQVKASPEYDPSAPVGRDYEADLHQHYGRDPYWR